MAGRTWLWINRNLDEPIEYTVVFGDEIGEVTGDSLKYGPVSCAAGDKFSCGQISFAVIFAQPLECKRVSASL